MPLSSGSALGPYQILGLLGRGGMGEVYRAHDARLARDVALKVLSTDTVATAEQLARFETEARAAAKLAHPNIVATYDVGCSNGVHFVVMELLEGVTLRERLDGGRLTPGRALHYALQIASGLAAAHTAGFVHRDLKPSNVFVTADDHVKLLDFGLAKAQGNAITADTVTVPGTILGTVSYMAPEQVRGRPLDHRADIFSFGVVLFEMLSGSRPFDGETPADTMSAILSADVPNLPRSLAGHATGMAIFRIINRCVDKHPDGRFDSAADLLFALEQVRDVVPTGALSAMLPPRLRLFAATSTRAFLLIGTAGVFLGGAAMWLTMRAPAPDARNAARPIARFEVRLPQISSAPLFVSLSPDAEAVAIGSGRAPTSVYMLATNETRALAGPPATGLGAWTPDGREFLMASEGRLVRADAAGRGVRPLTDIGEFGGAIWHGDDVIYADDGTIKRVPAAGGAPVTLCAPAGELEELLGPAAVVGDSHLLFFARTSTADRTGVYTSRLNEPCRPKLVVVADTWPKFAAPDRLLYTRSGVLYAQRLDVRALAVAGAPVRLGDDVRVALPRFRAVFDVTPTTLAYRTSGSATPRRLRLVDRAGRILQDVGPPALYRHPSLTPDGRSLLVARGGAQPDVASFDIATGIATPLTGGRPARYPRASRDGRFIAYAEETTTGYDLVVQRARLGAEKRVIFQSGTLLAVHDWSPDGRYLLFEHEDGDREADLYAIAVDSGAAPFVISRQPGFDTSGAFAPDGRHVAYLALTNQVFIASFPDGERVRRVSAGRGLGPRWNPDGTELFFVEPEISDGGWRLMSVSFRSTRDQQAPVIGTPTALFSSRFYFSGEAPNLGAPYDVGDGGRRFLILETTRDVVEPLTIVLNWSRLLDSLASR